MVPKPMLATVMRSDGAGRPPLPMAVAGIIVGKPSAVADAAMKRRREKVMFVFMVGQDGKLRVFKGLLGHSDHLGTTFRL